MDTAAPNTLTTVFLAHGRNKIAVAELSKFLRAVGLRPIEWIEAVDATQTGSPTTLEVVRTGLDMASCCVVLCTGDDFAQLHPAIDLEPVRPQPRPNVIFELGLALAVLGAEHTVIVTVGPLREISDIDGLNYVSLSNDPEARKELVARLRTAGCAVDDKGSSWLDPSASGDFDLVSPADGDGVMPSDLSGSAIAQDLTPLLVESAFSPHHDIMQLNEDLRRAVRDRRPVKMKHHYIGYQCATYWLAASAHPAYGHEALLHAVDDRLTEIILRLSLEGRPLNLVSLGCGDGRLDERILLRLQENPTVTLRYYYCIDVSVELLQTAYRRILSSNVLERDFPVKALGGDFEDDIEPLASTYLADPHSVNLLSLLGFTFGNSNENELMDTLQTGMAPGDYLLFDARLHDLAEWDGHRDLTPVEEADLVKHYDNQPNYQFAAGPVEVATDFQLTAGELDFGYQVERRVTTVDRAVNVILTAKNLDPERLTASSRTAWWRRHRDFPLASTTFYDSASLKRWLAHKGFELVWVEEIDAQRGRFGLFLIRQPVADVEVPRGGRRFGRQ